MQNTFNILCIYHCETMKKNLNGQSLITSLILGLSPPSHGHVICAFFPSPFFAP